MGVEEDIGWVRVRVESLIRLAALELGLGFDGHGGYAWHRCERRGEERRRERFKVEYLGRIRASQGRIRQRARTHVGRMQEQVRNWVRCSRWSLRDLRRLERAEKVDPRSEPARVP